MTDTSELPYSDGIDEATACLRDTEALLDKHRIPASPINYRLGYEAVSGRNGQLQADLDQLLAANPQPGLESLWALYRKWFVQDESSIETLRQELRRVLSDAQTQFEGSDEQYARYTEDLGQFARKLDDTRLSPRQLSGDVRRMIDETREFESVQREAHSRMHGLMQEVEMLRAELLQAREEAMTDGLTEIPNRKWFERTLRESVSHDMSGRPQLALLMIDVDHFKKFNDTYGHTVGDKVLRFVASTIKNRLDGIGKVARYGGEEFVALIPDADERHVERIAQDLLNAISGGELRDRRMHQTYGRITVSIGISRYHPGDEPQTLVDRADAALYAAKQAGRNCVKRAA